MTDIFATESEVQSYARSFPVVFNRAEGSYLYDNEGNQYLDFLAGAGTLNYGHNNPLFKEKLIAYLQENGITHGLDMHTEAKAAFLQSFKSLVLEPRGLDFKLQFTGPTGTNAVEAAMKIARKVTGRHNVIAFTNGFHGCTLGAAAATGNRHHRNGAGIPLGSVTRMPFDGYMGNDVDTTKLLDKMLGDNSSGVDLPAAVLVECIQGEGGLNVASDQWLQNLEKVCRKHDVLLIVDDIQAGCGRSGDFFSFERSGIKPDIVTLSKSLSGFGLPFALTLIRPDLDQWLPGEHNGTFRGNNHAFVTARAALEHYWQDDTFAKRVQHKADLLRKGLKAIADKHGNTLLQARGRGFMQGLTCRSGEVAEKICREAFSRGLVIETSGNEGQVVKCLCPLTISEEELNKGLDIISDSVAAVLKSDVSQAS